MHTFFFTGVAGVVYTTMRPYTEAFYSAVPLEYFLSINYQGIIGSDFVRRAPWIYYSRNISTTPTRP